ncbi:hypothetical protein B0H14DRAFT_3492297 [Mycena olivaceomarginata]|nr:hypothetical protein B0H14DRAFT_3492297 [Mycena olivaceomarginata]
MLSAPLYGIAIAQAIYYFRTFPKDVIYVKIVVVSLVVIDTAHLVLLISTLNNWFLVKFFNPAIPKAMSGTVLLTHITVFIAQMTYAARIWIGEGLHGLPRCFINIQTNSKLQKKAITGLVVALALLQISSGIVQTVETYLEDELGNVSAAKAFQTAGRIELGSSVACDVIIMGAMMYFLKSQASGGIQKTTQIVNKIVTYVIGVGIVTSAFTLANLILWVLITRRLYWLIFELMLMYFNSVLVMLNSRAKLRDELYGSTVELYSADDTSRTARVSTRNTASGDRK